jgi:hypothetical protein
MEFSMTPYAEMLRDALAQSDLATIRLGMPPSPPACQAAYRLALALGRCRLFGCDAGAADGTLPVEVAAAAGVDLCNWLELWRTHAERLGEDWDAAPPVEGELICGDVLSARMSAWAALAAIEEAYFDAVDNDLQGKDSLEKTLDQVLDRLGKFDDALHQQQELLATLTATHLLDNWRRELGPEYREMLPWWLDGTLEVCSERLCKEMLASLPGPEAWKRLRERSLAQGPAIMPLRRHSMDVVPVETAPAHLAAAGTRDASSTHVVGWRSPDGRYRARLHLPTEVTRGGDEELWLDFSTVDFDPAYELENQQIVLSDFELVIGSEARVVFRLAALQDARRRGVAELVLRVGQDGIEWPADRDERDSR